MRNRFDVRDRGLGEKGTCEGNPCSSCDKMVVESSVEATETLFGRVGGGRKDFQPNLGSALGDSKAGKQWGKGTESLRLK